MQLNKNPSSLLIAGNLSLFAAAMHIACIFGGPAWYRFFGAGEQMAMLAEQGSSYPVIVTLVIAVTLLIWALYAFSGAGVVRQLPLLKAGLVLITLVYITRGVAGFVLPFVTEHPAIEERTVTFWMVSSSICCIYGAFYFWGTKALFKSV